MTKIKNDHFFFFFQRTTTEVKDIGTVNFLWKYVSRLKPGDRRKTSPMAIGVKRFPLSVNTSWSRNVRT